MWKKVIGFEDSYEINEYGDVKNLRTGKLMRYYISNKGYKCVDLSRNGVKTKCYVHRLVALHFVPNPNNFPIVLHKDNVKLNTYYKNLKWGTYSENSAQAVRDGLTIVPRPDNRKDYMLYNNDNFIVCKGAKEAISKIGYGTKSLLFCLIHRDGEVVKGPLKGYKAKKATIITPIEFPEIIHPITFTKIG